MIQFRRLAALLLGIWLGASVLTDIAVTQNFQTVDRFLAAPGDPATAATLNQLGRPQLRAILRRNAAEENNFLFTNFEWAELALGFGLFLILLFGDRPQKLMLGLVLAMFLIVLAERTLLTPRIVELGRIIDGLPDADPRYRTFWMLHSAYSGLDILKMLLGAALGFRLAVRRAPDKDHFVKEYAKMNPAAAPGAPNSGPIRQGQATRG